MVRYSAVNDGACRWRAASPVPKHWPRNTRNLRHTDRCPTTLMPLTYGKTMATSHRTQTVLPFRESVSGWYQDPSTPRGRTPVQHATQTMQHAPTPVAPLEQPPFLPVLKDGVSRRF